MPRPRRRRETEYAPLDQSDLDPDPIRQFDRWYRPVLASDLAEPSAMSLATTTRDGRPSARTVLLKGFDQAGFVFFTNYESRKAKELSENPHAALVFNWIHLRRQVSVAGPVARVSAQESDAYFQTRARGSQLGAWASKQSEVIPSREVLERRLAELEKQYAGRDVPRPPHWGGFRLTPETVEFWQNRPNRLHDRFRYRREGGRWVIERLSP
jgi:pyridoxamine 5'-phosphate oxidase